MNESRIRKKKRKKLTTNEGPNDGKTVINPGGVCVVLTMAPVVQWGWTLTMWLHHHITVTVLAMFMSIKLVGIKKIGK